jgi:hypothetical protein
MRVNAFPARAALAVLGFGLFSCALLARAQTPAAQSPSPAAAPAHAIVQGVWQLNAAASTASGDLAGRAAGASQSSSRRGGGFGGLGGFGGRRGGGRSAGSSTPNLEKIRALVQEMATAPGKVTIVVQPTEVQLTYDTGQFFRYMTGDQQESHDLTNGTIKTRTRWDGPVLTQDIDCGNNFKFVRTYSVSGDQLIVTIAPAPGSASASNASTDSGEPAVEKRSVYDPVKGT